MENHQSEKIQKIEEPISIKEQEILLGDLGLKRYYNKIEKILRKYMDLKEEYYSLVSLWIIGTYLHKQFSTYPYLFFNAMKGSGKTRMLKIIANLSKKGSNAGSMTEAVLFRTANERTLCLDEMERTDKNEALNLILNSGYKKGLNVERMAKKKTLEGTQQVVEGFKVYCPIAMANINGIKDVLADRCISIVLEKSSNKRFTRLIENFENDMDFKTAKGGLMRLTEKITDDLNYFGDIIEKWNNWVEVSYLKGEQDTYDSQDAPDRYKALFGKIDKIEIEARDLELFFPLFIIADICGVLDKTIKLSQSFIKDKKEQDRDENMDVKIYDFVAQYPNKEFVFISTLTKEFREHAGVSDDWVNNMWLGKGLRRLNLVLHDRRQSRRSVVLDVDKAIEQMKIWV